jgi:hypothetical protein
MGTDVEMLSGIETDPHLLAESGATLIPVSLCHGKMVVQGKLRLEKHE